MVTLSALERALHLADLGLSIIPIRAGTKAPFVPWAEYQVRPAGPALLRRWFQEERPAGIVTGEVSGLVAVDCDSPEALAWAEANLPATPLQTLTSEKAPGFRGRHLFYRWPGAPVPNAVKLQTGEGTLALDIRGDGGQVLAPGSVHPSGARYEALGVWDADTLAGLPVFDPAWLKGPVDNSGQPAQDLFESPGPGSACHVAPSGNGKRPSSPGRPSVEERAASYLQALGPAVQGQGGDARTTRAAWAVAVEFGLPEPTARRVLQDWDRSNVPPWQDTEPEGLEAKLRTALAKAPGHSDLGRLAEEDRPAPAGPGGNGKVAPIRRAGRQGQAAPTSSAAVAVTSDEEEDLEEDPAPVGPQRPTLDPVALYGLAGEFVRLVEPETEADPAALLFSFLLAAGHCFGRSPYFLHERNVHRSNLFCLLVGDTASGRKGTSWGWVQDLFWLAAQDLPETCRVRIRSGLSSGEGVLECMRPPTPPEVPAGKEPPPVPLYDPRVFVLEGEFAGILKNFERKGNTLSSILRSAWDGIPIGTMTRNPIVVEEHHLTLLAHVTPTELAILLPQVETANGFLNRFLVVFTERSKSLPEGGSLPQEAMLPLAARLRDAILIARNVERVERDEGARRVWRAVYEDLACGHPGPMGAATSRALAQVSRLALIYALLDGRAVIQAPHLLAAVAAWKYCFDSAGMVFGDSTGSRTADKILQALRREPEGLTRTRIVREVLQGNCPREKLVAALALLKKYHLAEAQRIPPVPPARKASELWRAS